MRRIGLILALLAIMTTVLLGTSCGGAAFAAVPVSGHHHAAPETHRHHAILAHAPCCAPVTVPSREVVVLVIAIQPVAWVMPAEIRAAGMRITPEPRPPKRPV